MNGWIKCELCGAELKRVDDRKGPLVRAVFLTTKEKAPCHGRPHPPLAGCFLDQQEWVQA